MIESPVAASDQVGGSAVSDCGPLGSAGLVTNRQRLNKMTSADAQGVASFFGGNPLPFQGWLRSPCFKLPISRGDIVFSFETVRFSHTLHQVAERYPLLRPSRL